MLKCALFFLFEAGFLTRNGLHKPQKMPNIAS